MDYSTYKLNAVEYVSCLCVSGCALFLVGLIFYNHWLGGLVLASGSLLLPRLYRSHLLSKRKEQLNKQFKQALASLSTSLSSGRSVENAFKEVIVDLAPLYPDPNTYIIREFHTMNARLDNGEPLERVLHAFSKRADSADITNFSEVFATCKRSGSNLVEVIRRTSDMISDKMDIQQEISVLIARKKFEARLMCFIPLVMVGLLSLTAADYMSPLYEWQHYGPIIMTMSLAVLVFCMWVCQRLMNIKL